MNTSEQTQIKKLQAQVEKLETVTRALINRIKVLEGEHKKLAVR